MATALQEPQSLRLGLTRFFRDCFVEKDGVPGFRMSVGGRWVEFPAHRLMDVRSPINGSVIVLPGGPSGQCSDGTVAPAGGITVAKPGALPPTLIRETAGKRSTNDDIPTTRSS